MRRPESWQDVYQWATVIAFGVGFGGSLALASPGAPAVPQFIAWAIVASLAVGCLLLAPLPVYAAWRQRTCD